MEGKIIVVTHKDYMMPDLPCYLPVCVGTGRDNLKHKFQPDNVGINISDKNNLYCELTALYWAWKNLDVEYLGLAHYRRHFSQKKNSKKINDAITDKQIEELLTNFDIIVPKMRKYNQSIANHYINCIKSRKVAHQKHLELLREVILELKPDYLDAYDCVMNGHKAHMLNMFIMKKADVNDYCQWLFDILFALEEKIKENNVCFERIMGAFSEFLLDVWIKQNHKSVVETHLIETEKNFIKKVKWALKRKLFE